MNAVFAAVLLAVVATCSGTVVTGLGSQYYYTPSAYQYAVPSTYQSPYQYTVPSTYNYGYNYVKPVVASSSVVSAQTVPVNYATSAYTVPSTYSSALYGVNYPYTYTYGGYGLLKK